MDPVRFPPIGRPSSELGIPESERAGTSQPATGPSSFSHALENAIDSVSRVQAESDESTRLFALGKDVDLHTVLLQVEKADLSFRTMMEVRNKLLDAYREIMRMQI